MPSVNIGEWPRKTQGGRFGQKSLFCLFKLFDVRIGYFFLIFVIPFYMIFSHKGYKAIYWYSRNILNYSRIKSLFFVYQNHYTFGQILLDRFSIFAGNKHSYKVNIEGNEFFLERLRKPDGGIILSAHVGNFEIAGYLMNQNLKKIRPLVFKHEAELYKELRSSNLAGNNIEPIEIDEKFEHIFQIYNALKVGDYISMPSDRFLGRMKKMEIEFMGRKTYFPAGAFHLAASFNLPVFVIFVMKERGKTYNIFVRFLSPVKDEKVTNEEKALRLLKDYVMELERIVSMYPSQWFNFFQFWNMNTEG